MANYRYDNHAFIILPPYSLVLLENLSKNAKESLLLREPNLSFTNIEFNHIHFFSHSSNENCENIKLDHLTPHFNFALSLQNPEIRNDSLFLDVDVPTLENVWSPSFNFGSSAYSWKLKLLTIQNSTKPRPEIKSIFDNFKVEMAVSHLNLLFRITEGARTADFYPFFCNGGMFLRSPQFISGFDQTLYERRHQYQEAQRRFNVVTHADTATLPPGFQNPPAPPHQQQPHNAHPPPTQGLADRLRREQAQVTAGLTPTVTQPGGGAVGGAVGGTAEGAAATVDSAVGGAQTGQGDTQTDKRLKTLQTLTENINKDLDEFVNSNTDDLPEHVRVLIDKLLVHNNKPGLKIPPTIEDVENE